MKTYEFWLVEEGEDLSFTMREKEENSEPVEHGTFIKHLELENDEALMKVLEDFIEFLKTGPLKAPDDEEQS